MGKIYLIENTINGKIYIGMTTGSISGRIKDHLRSAENGSPFRLHTAIRKYGFDKFNVKEIDDSDSRKQLAELEKMWINYYNSMEYDVGYNMTLGGDGAAGRELSESTRQKLSSSISKHRNSLNDIERKELTKAANSAKRGHIESEDSRRIKSNSQKNRFSKMTEDQLKQHGQKSLAGVSPEGKIRQAMGMNLAFSPRRQKGFKDELTKCPHCNKIGGKAAMKRYHFDRCKLK